VGRRLRAVAALVLVAGLLAACTDDGEGAGPTTTDPSTSAAVTTAETGLPPVDGPFAAGRTQIPGFGEVEVRIVPGPDGEPVVLCVLLAETTAQRQRGLMEVTDPGLGGYDGMLFTYPADTAGGFYMRDTPLPLSIAYLDAEGATVDTKDMEPCLDRGDECPTYPPSGPYRMTLEVPEGGLDELGLAVGSPSRLEVAGACRPRAGPG
jgi:uncharacterized membrane protein (UPF0127 family)